MATDNVGADAGVVGRDQHGSGTLRVGLLEAVWNRGAATRTLGFSLAPRRKHLARALPPLRTLDHLPLLVQLVALPVKHAVYCRRERGQGGGTHFKNARGGLGFQIKGCRRWKERTMYKNPSVHRARPRGSGVGAWEICSCLAVHNRIFTNG